MIEFGKNPTTHETIVRFNDVDVLGRTQAYLIEMVVTKLSDKFVQEHGDDILKHIDVDKLREQIEGATIRHLTAEATYKKDEDS